MKNLFIVFRSNEWLDVCDTKEEAQDYIDLELDLFPEFPENSYAIIEYTPA